MFGKKWALLLILVGWISMAPLRAQDCAPVPDGIVSWWPGEGDASDIVSGNDGTLIGGVTFAAGLVGQAFSLNGVDGFVSVPDDPSLSFGTNDFTVDLWVNFNATDGEQVLIEKYIETFDTSAQGWTFTKLADQRLRVSFAGHQVVDSGTVTIPAGTWTHLAFRRNNGAVTLFMNGVAIASGSDPANVDSTSSLKLGHRGNPDDTPGSKDTRQFYLNGLIDEVDVFNRALTEEEIQAIVDAGSAGKCQAES